MACSKANPRRIQNQWVGMLAVLACGRVLYAVRSRLRLKGCDLRQQHVGKRQLPGASSDLDTQYRRQRIREHFSKHRYGRPSAPKKTGLRRSTAAFYNNVFNIYYNFYRIDRLYVPLYLFFSHCFSKAAKNGIPPTT